MIFNEKIIEHEVVCCDPMPEEEFLKTYYKEKYYQEGKGSYDTKYTEEEIQHKIYEADLIVYSLLNYLGEKNTSDCKLLELGCGEGFLLYQSLQSGFNVLGVDHSSFAIKKWHPNLYNSSFIQSDIYQFLKNRSNEGVFDICIIKNVLEHVVDPLGLLNDIKYILQPKGKLVVTIPNDYSCLQKKLLELELVSVEEWFCPPDHLYYFNTNNFSSYVEKVNYKVLDMYSSFPVDVFLLNQHSNYFNDKSKGKEAHYSRVRMDLLIKDSGFANALNLYRSMAKCGIGRNFTTILQKK